MIRLDVASTDRHFDGILDLQRRYHTSTLPPEVQLSEGFVFVEHTVALLRRMAAELPQAIALEDDVVVGYCLALPLSLRDEVASLAPMFEQFRRCSYHGRPLAGIEFYVGGQVCVDRPYRGRGLLASLYRHIASCASPSYELCVTEIATRNPVSIRAHEKMGFETISTYSDEREEWVISAWRIDRKAPEQSVNGMTVNERLVHFDLVAEFDAAAKARNKAALITVLLKARFTQSQAEYTSASLLDAPQRYGY